MFEDILRDGGIISEFNPGTEPLRTYFPSRNRIISGLSDIVLVVEARKRSGTYITVTSALDQGREVFAVPGRITDALSDGCNNLIVAGAEIAVNSEAIIRDLRNKGFKYVNGSFEGSHKRYINMDYNHKDDIVLNDSGIGENSLEDILLSIISENECSLDIIYQKLGDKYSIEDLSISLVELEMDGKIMKKGSRYIANI